MRALVVLSFVVVAGSLVGCTFGTPVDQRLGAGGPGGGGGGGPGGGGGDEGEGEGTIPRATLDVARSTLASDPAISQPADGIAAFTITAHLVDSNGAPMPGVNVDFASSLGVIGRRGVTNASGDATVPLSSNNAGDATVTAAVGDAALAPLTVRFEGCRTAAQAYEQELYPKVFSRCQGCHNELGIGRKEGVYELPFPGVDDWAQRSVDVLTPLAATTSTTTDGEELPRLVGKPTERFADGHGGGQVIGRGSEEERLLTAFAARLTSPDSCTGVDDPAAAALTHIELLSPRDTYARAKLALTGQVATPEELAGIDDTEESLDAQLDALLSTNAFAKRVADWYADWFLTDRYTKQLGGRKILNRNSQYTRRFFFGPEGTRNQQCDPSTDDCCSELFPAAYCAGKENALIDSLAREPVNIIADIVKNDRPISDAITLDHTILTPLTATFYGFTDAERAAMFDANTNNDASETATGQIHRTPLNKVGGGNRTSVQYPHAGVLTTESMLARWPTTTSNKNRGRAQSIIMRRLLDIDVMKFAEFSTATLPPDADLEQATQEYVACTACHAAVDPIAGLWKHYTNFGLYNVTAPGFQTQGMPAPSFLGQQPAQGEDPLQFLAAQVVQHERFPLAMLMPVLQGLTGFSELDNHVEPSDPDFEAKSLAIAIQHEILTNLRASFADTDGLRVKALVKDVVKSELFRAKSLDSSSLSDVEKKALALAGVGRGVMITPEQLDRKLQSIFGFDYRANRSPTGTQLLLDVNQYRILFGGINDDAIAVRFRDPSPVLARIVERMANEMSCVAVPQDFATTDRTQRKLFTLVDATDDGDAAVRAQIKRLHALLLDEDLNDGDPELEATVSLFNDVLSQGRGLVAGGDSSAQLRSDCRATKSYDAAQTPYPTAGKVVVTNDPRYIIRAWMAVVSYLLSDPRFITE